MRDPRLLGSSESAHIDAFRRVLQEENGVRQQRTVATEVGKLDQSLREALNQQLSTALQEITNRENSTRVRMPPGSALLVCLLSCSCLALRSSNTCPTPCHSSCLRHHGQCQECWPLSQVGECTLEQQRQMLRDEHERKAELCQKQTEAACEQRLRTVEADARTTVTACERRIADEEAKLAQVRPTLRAQAGALVLLL